MTQAAAWRVSDLATKADYSIALSDHDRAALLAALDAVKASGRTLDDVSTADLDRKSVV